jgi:hypothetical protein
MRTRALLASVLLALLAAGCAAPKVVQGTVVSNDPTTHQLVIKDELPPRAEVPLFTEGAEIGAPPVAGDLVRIAYHERDGKRHATRVANLSHGEIKQKK